MIDALQSDIDHLHLLVDIEPKISALQVAHQVKQISTFTKQYTNPFLKLNSGKRIRFFRMGILFAQQVMQALKQYRSTLKNEVEKPT